MKEGKQLDMFEEQERKDKESMWKYIACTDTSYTVDTSAIEWTSRPGYVMEVDSTSAWYTYIVVDPATE